MFSFAPGSKWDITFPTFQEIKVPGPGHGQPHHRQGLFGHRPAHQPPSYSAVPEDGARADGVVQGAVLWAPKGQVPLIRRSNRVCGEALGGIFSRSLQGDGRLLVVAVPNDLNDPKEILKNYVRQQKLEGRISLRPVRSRSSGYMGTCSLGSGRGGAGQCRWARAAGGRGGRLGAAGHGRDPWGGSEPRDSVARGS